MCDKTITTIKKMLSVSTPIIVANSYDHPHLKQRIAESIGERPAVNWSITDGYTPINELGESAIDGLDPQDVKQSTANVGGAIHVAKKFPPSTTVIVENLHWYWDTPVVKQAILNLREPYKATKRCLIGLVLGSALPADLVQATSYVDDPLPDEETLREKTKEIFYSAYGDSEKLDEDEASGIARELRGTSPFRAEQLTALSLTKSDGIDRSKLRDNARKQINDTAGLSVESTTETFADIGGLDAMQEFLRRYFDGPRRPSVVVRIEEIEKALAGVGTESSGTSGDALGALLTAMEDNRWTGILAYGVSGCGKSLVAKAAANQFGAKAIRFDLNACKGSLVGESEKQIRAAMEVLEAIGGERVFFIASMNQIASLPPELRRRFAAGTWYFDVPDAEGRKDIWNICCEKFGVTHDGYDAEMLAGADIRDICQRAYELSCTITEAAAYHVPLCKAAPDAIANSRSDATGRYLDANAGGPYRDPSSAEVKYERSIELS